MPVNALQTVEPDLSSPEFAADPYRYYDQLRSEDPVHWSERWQGWILTRYDDVMAGLRDPRLSLEAGVAEMFERLPVDVKGRLEPLRRHVSLWLGARDPANHRRLRSALQQGFTQDAVEHMRNLTTEVARELIGRCAGERRMDVVRDYAFPLPATVIGALLGAPVEDCDRFQSWSRSLTRFIAYGFLQTDAMFEAQKTVQEMTDYLACQLSPNEPSGGGLIRRMLNSPGESQEATLEEILANCVLILFAGHETTTLLIANAAMLLLRQPHQADQLRAAPDLARRAIMETLRLESPVQLVRRYAVEDLRIRGTTIPKGHMVWLALGAANRDPEVFPDPASFDIRREPEGHVAFGGGPHYCLGARLSTMEAEVALLTLLESRPGLRLEAPQRLQWEPNPTARALAALPVVWGA
jgi:cytochrome P450